MGRSQQGGGDGWGRVLDRRTRAKEGAQSLGGTERGFVNLKRAD